MKIYRKAIPLPLDEIPIEYGEQQIDMRLTEEMVRTLDEKYHFKESLGGGMWGMAFLTQDDKVLKLTTDESEVEAAKLIKDVRHGPFAKVYEIGSIPDYKNAHLVHYIVKEFVTPLTEDQASFFYQVEESINDNEEAETLRQSDPVLYESIYDYINDVANYGFADTNSVDNIGIDSNGNLVSFDARMSEFAL